MPKYLTFHAEPERLWEDLVEKYRTLARETTAVWIRTYIFEDGTQRVCEWDAPAPEPLHVIFTRTGISYDRIVPVREVLPSSWR